MSLRNLHKITDKIFSNPERSLKLSFVISAVAHISFFLIMISINVNSPGNEQITLDSQRSNITLINYSSVQMKKEYSDTSEIIKTEGDIPLFEENNRDMYTREDAANASFSAEGLAAKETYETDILKRIHRMKYYPQYARKMGNEGRVYLKFTLAKDGSLKGPVGITEECGYDILNKAAVTTIKHASPFPPFPERLSREKDSITFNVELEYNLNIPAES